MHKHYLFLISILQHTHSSISSTRHSSKRYSVTLTCTPRGFPSLPFVSRNQEYPRHLSNYEQIEAEKAKLKVAEETQKLVTLQAETARKKAVIEAEKESAVATIRLERTLAEKRNAQTMASISNEIYLAQIQAEADANFYRAQKEAASNQLLLTPELLQLESIRALANNTKIYFGEHIPNIFLNNHPIVAAAAGGG